VIRRTGWSGVSGSLVFWERIQGPSRRAGDAKIPVLCSAHQCFGQESFYWFSVVTGGANLSWVASNKNYSLPDGEHYELSLQRENWCRHDRDRKLRGTPGTEAPDFCGSQSADAALCSFL